MIKIPTIIDERIDFQVLNNVKKFKKNLPATLGFSENEFRFEKDKKIVRKISSNLRELFNLTDEIIKRIKANRQKVKGKIKERKKRK